MKIVVIHGSPRKGNTYKAVNTFKNEMEKQGDIEFIEYFFPKDMPEFCCGCFNCFLKDEDLCPHAEYAQPIIKSFREADGMIFSSPVYVMGMSGALKVFFDHLGYLFVIHRPMEEMFSKKAMIICTTAGGGIKDCITPIKKNLKFWGVNKIYTFGIKMYAEKWEKMNIKKQHKANLKLSKRATRFYNTIKSNKQYRPYLLTSFMFNLSRKILKKNVDEYVDKVYWKEKGWLNKTKSPFRSSKG